MALLLTGLFRGPIAWAGNVRTVYTDSSAMAPINLRMGQSTVLRFPEKPKKVIVGNSNYYSIEFIDNDVAIQPLGTVPTNLFIYGPKNVYGFLLRTVANGIYDDLVQVQWKQKTIQPTVATVKVLAIREVSRPNLLFPVGRSLSVHLTRIQRYKRGDFSILDFRIENGSKNDVSLAGIQFVGEQNRKRITPQEFILKTVVLKPEESTTARLLLNLPSKRDFTLSVKWRNDSIRQIISGKFL